jgi:hypothetical protein
MIDDSQKRFILHLAIDNDFFHSAFVKTLYDLKQKASQSGVRLTAHLPIECLMDKYCMRWRHSLKKLSVNGEQADFSKKPLRHFL